MPYFFSSWLLLSVILFVQQASRYSDIFFNVNIPTHLIWQLAFALLPNVIAFTCPMAILVGTIIGLAKLQGDSELIAMRSSGVGNLQIALPIIVIGILLSIFAFVVNLKGVPLAASLVRNIALQTAIKKLESPIEPGVFNTEVAGYTIYVRGGDIESGRWESIFIYSKDTANSTLKLITSRSGRIDYSGESSELVLDNASVTTLPLHSGEGKYIYENIGHIRLAIKTSRSELVKKLSSSELAPEELGLQQLSEYAAEKGGKEREEALILQQRRLLLSITPLIFCILGTVLVLRFNRGGRGFGITVALIVLVGFYLLAFLGEQLVRTGTIGIYASTLLPIGGSVAAIIWFALTRRLDVLRSVADRIKFIVSALRRSPSKVYKRDLFVDLTTGLGDFDLISNLLKHFVLALCFLTVLFVVFTAFELWKFAGVIDGGSILLAKYIFFLMPFVYLQIAPAAIMIAILATYLIKSRQNELVTWASAGKSVYRLLMPCFLLAFLLGVANWLIQEKILPGFNKRQDTIRAQIRSKGVLENFSDNFWVARGGRVFSFRTIESDETQKRARAIFNSDDFAKECGWNCGLDILICELGNEADGLRTVYRSPAAIWHDGRLSLIGNVERSELIDGKIVNSFLPSLELAEKENPFTQIRWKPTHLDSSRLRHQIDLVESELEKRNLTVALQKKYALGFLPLVIALFTAPFSLSLNRTGNVTKIGVAVALWLLFTGVSSIFEQLGLNGFLSPELAVWAPILIFAFLGIYFLSRLRT